MSSEQSHQSREKKKQQTTKDDKEKLQSSHKYIHHQILSAYPHTYNTSQDLSKNGGIEHLKSPGYYKSHWADLS